MDYDNLPVSDGSGDAALMHVSADRTVGSTTLAVDTVVNVPTKFIATTGDLGADGFITQASKCEFYGHLSGSDLEIDGFMPGSSDVGNTEGQVVVIRPNTGWANKVADFIKNLKNFGTPEDIWAAAVNAVSAVFSGDVEVDGDTSMQGDLTVDGIFRNTSAGVASGSTITPTAQIYNVTALAAAATINVPSFAAADGINIIIRIKDNGTARALTFASGYTNVSGLDTPTTTVANKLLTVGAMYNASTSKWEIQGINQEA